MALQTCRKHCNSEGETVVVIYETHARNSSVVKCPMCELARELDSIKNPDKPEGCTCVGTFTADCPMHNGPD